LRRGRTVQQLTAAAMTIALAGCTPAGPSTDPTSHPTTPSTQRPTEPPAIPRALDASRYADDKVCELLDDNQSKALGFPGAGDSSSSPPDRHACYRGKPLEDPLSLNLVVFLSTNRLAEVYGLKETRYRDFIPVTISGQPAVRRRQDFEEPVTRCNVVVGLSESQGVEMHVTDDSGKACELAMRAAEQIVRNLGG
jgi:uncharacterized protein DUF3558